MPRWMHGLVRRPWAPPQQCYHQCLQLRWPYHLLPLSFYGWVWTLMVLCRLTLLDSCVLVGLWPGSYQMVVESFAALCPLLPLMFQVVIRLCHPYLCRGLRLHWLQRKKSSLASFTCFCWWCVHLLPWSSVLGSFLLHHRLASAIIGYIEKIPCLHPVMCVENRFMLPSVNCSLIFNAFQEPLFIFWIQFSFSACI